ncbi:MAG: hypothetical protein GXC76_01460 [Rhodanobacteraceae bacterium]|nr:hypothetical protein [Rhodanobacteraceae bacterium]
MAEKKTELPVVKKLLDRIVQSPQYLIALETRQAAEVLAQMRVLAMRGGTSIYLWEPQGGLASLRESGLYVPGSKRMTDALRYVLQSMHFGIYLFVDFDADLKPVDALLLRRIARLQGANERKLVFVGGHLELPEELDGMFERITAEDDERRPLRLRDGRWVS